MAPLTSDVMTQHLATALVPHRCWFSSTSGWPRSNKKNMPNGRKIAEKPNYTYMNSHITFWHLNSDSVHSACHAFVVGARVTITATVNCDSVATFNAMESITALTSNSLPPEIWNGSTAIPDTTAASYMYVNATSSIRNSSSGSSSSTVSADMIVQCFLLAISCAGVLGNGFVLWLRVDGLTAVNFSLTPSRLAFCDEFNFRMVQHTS